MNNANNVNIAKVKALIKERGLKIKFVCAELGLSETYLSNVKNGIDRMTEDRLRKIALMLGTSYEYLTDQTDDPSMIEDSETVKASVDFIRDSSARLLEQINDTKNLENIAELTLKSEIAKLLDDTHNIQTLKMIKAALEAAEKGDE